MKKKYSYRGLIAGFILGTSVTAGVMTVINRAGRNKEISKNSGISGEAVNNTEPIQVIISENNGQSKVLASPVQNTDSADEPLNLKCFPKAHSKTGPVILRENPSDTSKIIAELPNFDCLNKIMDSGDWRYVKVPNGDLSGYVHKSQVVEGEKDYVATHVVSSGDGFANVRSGGTKSSKALRALPSGTPVTVFPEAVKGRWEFVGYMFENKYEYGYIHKSILKEIE